jgi:hypothetical protein
MPAVFPFYPFLLLQLHDFSVRSSRYVFGSEAALDLRLCLGYIFLLNPLRIFLCFLLKKQKTFLFSPVFLQKKK